MARTQEQRKAETRTRLLDAAARLFARHGFDATSTDAVAEAADRTSGAVYAHFGSKEGLLLALLDEWETEVAARMGEALAAAPDGRARTDTMWEHFTKGVTGDDTWLLLEHELLLQAARNDDVRAVLARRFAHARRGIGQAVDEWAAEDSAGAPPVRPGSETATLVLALLLGLEMQRRLDPDSVPDRVAVSGLDALIGAPSRAENAPSLHP